jgi:hypothetical protein
MGVANRYNNYRLQLSTYVELVSDEIEQFENTNGEVRNR